MQLTNQLRQKWVAGLLIGLLSFGAVSEANAACYVHWHHGVRYMRCYHYGPYYHHYYYRGGYHHHHWHRGYYYR